MTGLSEISLALGEGWRNAISGRAVSLVLGGICALLCAGVSAADAVAVANLVSEEQRWIAAGGNVLVVTNAAGPQSIPVLPCERLNQAPGVRAAVGVLKLPTRTGLGNAPDANLSIIGVTAGITGFLRDAPPPDAVIMSLRTADDYGVEGQQWVHLSVSVNSQTARLVGSESGTNGAQYSASALGLQMVPGVRRLAVRDVSILGDEYSSGVILLMPVTAWVDTCLVWVDPGTKETIRLALSGLLQGPGDKPTVSHCVRLHYP